MNNIITLLLLLCYRETVVVFDCNDTHCMCLDCFLEYTGLALRERRFIERQDCGYTIKCPSKVILLLIYLFKFILGGCDDSYVTEIHHFQLLGPEMVQLLHN